MSFLSNYFLNLLLIIPQYLTCFICVNKSFIIQCKNYNTQMNKNVAIYHLTYTDTFWMIAIEMKSDQYFRILCSVVHFLKSVLMPYVII